MGNENNLFTIVAYVEDEGENSELCSLKCLIAVTGIKNFHIYGNDMLLLGREVRYLALFDQLSNRHSSKNMTGCELKYKWAITPSG
jgi:hypothetical protein